MTKPDATTAIRGLGTCLPPQVLTNDEVAQRGGLDTTDAWIRSRTGIVRRHHVTKELSTGDLAVSAGRAALQSAHATTADCVILATSTPDRRCPATAPEVAHRLGLGAVPAFDLNAVCSGFVYGLAVASSLVTAGLCRQPLLIASETYSRIVDPLDRETAVIFGDGAGAVLLGPASAGSPGTIAGIDLESDGSGSELITIAAGGSRLPGHGVLLDRDLRYFRMQGKDVYRQAVRHMHESSLKVLSLVGWTADSVEAFIGHQANQRILDAVADRLGIDPHYRFGNIHDVANTAAASIPLAMASTASQAAVRPGAPTLLTAFGGGLTWGSVALHWPDARPVDLTPSATAPGNTSTFSPPTQES
ncbi:beta-ketoacyl-ACP synthase III [Streptomyces longwoodensis]|uniref:beta-ketoacyl-ACP synthase III n=1 Tax=Streptomyces longwoodensis TaxID=68231 RepID=UPI0033F78F32